MIIEKNTKHPEQNLLYKDVTLPEVCEHQAPNVRRIVDFVRTDTRSKSEIFESLKQRIQADYAGTLTEEEAIAATRRFIGFFQALSDIYDEKQPVALDECPEQL